MEGIRHAANSKLVSGTRGKQVVVLVGLRQLLQRLLAAVGSLVALSTLAIGASSTLEQSLAAGSGQSAAATLPPQFVLVFGGAGSLLVAVFYVPAAGALERRGQSLSAELFPLNEANEASAILSLAENRNKLEQLLGVGMAFSRTCRRAWPSVPRSGRRRPTPMPSGGCRPCVRNVLTGCGC